MKNKTIGIVAAAGFAVALGWATQHHVVASDHDDGSQSTAQNNLNLTDLFVFREDNQTGQGADSGNLVMIMDSNGHTPAGQQVFFSTQGQYDFHISRVTDANMDATPTGKEDVVLRFEFAEPDQDQHQAVKVTAIRDGKKTEGKGDKIITTTLAEGQAGTTHQNTVEMDEGQVTVFAGLREDPFFFDVEQFFKVRAGAAGLGPSATFRSPDQAVDGFAHQNVNSIVVRVPISYLQSDAGEPVFDVWETTSTK